MAICSFGLRGKVLLLCYPFPYLYVDALRVLVCDDGVLADELGHGGLDGGHVAAQRREHRPQPNVLGVGGS